MKRYLVALLAAATLLGSGIACAPSQPPQARHCADGQPPVKVTPMQTYVLEQCTNGEIITLNVPQQYQQYGNGGGNALNDPYFWLWMTGSNSYSHYAVYHHYVASPVYRQYNTTVYRTNYRQSVSRYQYNQRVTAARNSANSTYRSNFSRPSTSRRK